ncbi:cell wall-binding repeat-containing protein [Bacillus sp. 2205SS5-2]|uniref:cell wall-binding repeat-containing protein n=1 Tax=Bacillus sp. 2205SS5-2 TaxID=3109031 RepID=UPI003005A545
MRNKKIIGFMLALILIISVSVPTLAAGLFEDDNLEKTVRDYLGNLEEDEVITKEMLTDLYTLRKTESDNKIKSLSGLEHATNLSNIYLPGNKISDLSPIRDLEYLYGIGFPDNNITDISALANWSPPLIGSLSLRGNEISDISPLSSITVTGQVYLDFYNNQLEDITPLKNITKISRINAGNNRISDISGLQNKPLLQVVTLEDNLITDISPLSQLAQQDFTQLRLANNYISDITALKDIKDGSIFLKGNPLNREAEGIINTLTNRGVYVEYDPIDSRHVSRTYGGTRYDTAAQIAQSGWDSSDNVVITKGSDFPDSLAGASLAYQLDAPILLTQSNKLNDSAKNEITRLNAKKAIILGGTSAISPQVQEDLRAMGLETERIAGASRYETAVNIAKKLEGNADTAILTYGYNFPDALAVAPYAAQNSVPILLTNKNNIRAETKELLKNYSNIIVIGGTSAISDEAIKGLPNVTRIGGANRFDTTAQIIQTLNMNSTKAFVANGRGFADALTGSVLAAKQNAPLLLVEQNKVPTEILRLMHDQKMTDLVIFGGTNAVNSTVFDTIEN